MQNWADMGQTNLTTGGLDPSTLCKKSPYSEFFWFVFSHIWTEFGLIPAYTVSLRIHSEYGKYGPEKLQIQTLLTQ